MIRKIIRIDEEKRNGCGICAAACHEGAIEVIAGKAKLTREDSKSGSRHSALWAVCRHSAGCQCTEKPHA